jgi:hypothetical protein
MYLSECFCADRMERDKGTIAGPYFGGCAFDSAEISERRDGPKPNKRRLASIRHSRM